MTRERTPNDLCTPSWLIDRVGRIGPVTLDPCSNPWACPFADRTLSLDAGEDGLAESWEEVSGGGLTFVNPPYGRGHLARWADKIAFEAMQGTEIVALTPTASTRWADTLRRACRARVDLAKRISFGGGKHGAGLFDSTLWYAGPSPYLFAHVFADVGEVRIYR